MGLQTGPVVGVRPCQSLNEKNRRRGHEGLRGTWSERTDGSTRTLGREKHCHASRKHLRGTSATLRMRRDDGAGSADDAKIGAQPWRTIRMLLDRHEAVVAGLGVGSSAGSSAAAKRLVVVVLADDCPDRWLNNRHLMYGRGLLLCRYLCLSRTSCGCGLSQEDLEKTGKRTRNPLWWTQLRFQRTGGRLKRERGRRVGQVEESPESRGWGCRRGTGWMDNERLVTRMKRADVSDGAGGRKQGSGEVKKRVQWVVKLVKSLVLSEGFRLD